MHIPKKAALLLAPSLTLAVLGVGSPAFAVDSEPSRTDTPVTTAAPAEPEETLTEGAPESEAPAPLEPAGKPPVDNGAWARPCEPGWKYFATSKGKDSTRESERSSPTTTAPHRPRDRRLPPR